MSKIFVYLILSIIVILSPYLVSPCKSFLKKIAYFEIIIYSDKIFVFQHEKILWLEKWCLA